MTWWRRVHVCRGVAWRLEELERVVVDLHRQRKTLERQVADLEARMGDREAAARMAAEARTVGR